MAPTPPAGILETVIYCEPSEREVLERFYADTVGLRQAARWEDGTAFRVGPGVLLLFDRERVAGRESPMSDHGTSGPGHVCFVAEPGEYEDWLGHLRHSDVEVVQEAEWRDGLRSAYFRDPAGNLLEIAEADIWPGGAQ